MKKLYSLILAFLLLAVLTACGDSTVEDAKIAFQNNDYQTVISLLENFESEDPEAQNMLLISKIHIAYDEKDYQSVVELASTLSELSDDVQQIVTCAQVNIDFENKDYQAVVKHAATLGEIPDDMQQMVTFAQASVDFNNKNYDNVVTLLSTWDNRNDMDMYNISVAYAIDAAFSSYDSTALLTLYQADKEIEDTVYQLITDKCNSFDYECFIFAEDFTSILPDSMLKLELDRYLSNSAKIKTKAFMQGDWVIVYDEATNDIATVRCHVHEDDSQCVGVLTQFSNFMVDYHYTVNDMYWTGFTFENNVPVAVNNLVRYVNGDYRYAVAAVELSFDQEEMRIHVTGTTNPDRIYKKVHNE